MSDLQNSLRKRTLHGAAIAIVALVAGAAVVWNQVQGLDLDQLTELFFDISPVSWCLALLTTYGSFWALGRYDAIWHAQLGTGVSRERAQKSGMAAIAIGQTLGVASITSAFIRWRCLPELSGLQIAKVTAAVSASFMVCWAFIAVPAAWILAAPFAGFQLTMTHVLPAVVVATAAVVVVGRTLGFPLHQMGRLLSWTAVDLAFAGLTLWLLMPSSVGIEWPLVITAYVLALGAGIIGNSPGGLGPFEAVLLAILPAVGAEEILCAVLAYRVIYFLVPFCVAVIYAAAPQRKESNALKAVSGPADWHIACQSGDIRKLGPVWVHAYTPVPGFVISLGDPLPSPNSETAAHALPWRLQATYKASASFAAAVRRAGWTVSPIAQEAIIDPLTWTLDGPEKKRLRQALRRAERAGVTIERIASDTKTGELTRVAKAWATAQGGELGLSMGRYDSGYISHQSIFAVCHDKTLKGFITCNVADNWSLDLIRHDGTLPDGAMHLAIHAAIAAAKQHGASEFSLGSVPTDNGPMARWSGSKEGLRRFKKSFDPTWSTRYLVARSRIQWIFAAMAMLYGVQRPFARMPIWVMRRIHDHLERFTFVSKPDSDDTRLVSEGHTQCSPK